MPVDLDAMKALYATMLDHIQHAKWTAANRAACKIADDIPALIAELRELRAANRWRPIAEAPPPNRVELWWPYWATSVQNGFLRENGRWCSSCVECDDPDFPGPTHWRPMSGPPEGA